MLGLGDGIPDRHVEHADGDRALAARSCRRCVQSRSIAGRDRPLFFLDLAVPRDFEPAIGDRLGVYLYSIDDLQAACDRNRRERDKVMTAIPAGDGELRLTGTAVLRPRMELRLPKHSSCPHRLLSQLTENQFYTHFFAVTPVPELTMCPYHLRQVVTEFVES
mgnify:CR=1 FL=1